MQIALGCLNMLCMWIAIGMAILQRRPYALFILLLAVLVQIISWMYRMAKKERRRDMTEEHQRVLEENELL